MTKAHMIEVVSMYYSMTKREAKEYLKMLEMNAVVSIESVIHEMEEGLHKQAVSSFYND